MNSQPRRWLPTLDALDDGTDRVVVDLSAAGHLHEACLDLLVGLAIRFHGQGRQLVVRLRPTSPLTDAPAVSLPDNFDALCSRPTCLW